MNKTTVPIRLNWLVQTILEMDKQFQLITITENDEGHDVQTTYYHFTGNSRVQAGDLQRVLQYGTPYVLKPHIHSHIHAVVRLTIIDTLSVADGFLCLSDIMRCIEKNVIIQYQAGEKPEEA